MQTKSQWFVRYKMMQNKLNNIQGSYVSNVNEIQSFYRNLQELLMFLFKFDQTPRLCLQRCK